MKQSIAVTGGIAMGKSTVLETLKSLGATTASADEIAAEILAETAFHERVDRELGFRVQTSRDELRRAIVEDSNLRRRLNAILHPEVVRRIRAKEVQFVEVPLLVEACLYAEFRSVWVVACDRETQLERLTARLGSRLEAERLIDTQLPIEVKLAFADATIRTNQPRESVRNDIKRLFEAVR